jgi:hypothetical protein
MVQLYRTLSYSTVNNGSRNYQCSGSGWALDPHVIDCWIRICNRILNAEPDPDPERVKIS